MTRLNSEFNYRYQVIGETVWAKIQTLKDFLGGRERAAVLEEVARLKYRAKLAELKQAEGNGVEWRVLELQAELLELESFHAVQAESFQQNQDEIACLKRLLAELYAQAEPTRVKGYTDDQMFELNAANEFTAMIVRDIYAEIVATGHPSPAKIRNAMSNPHTWTALQQLGLALPNIMPLEASVDPLKIGLRNPLKAIE